MTIRAGYPTVKEDLTITAKKNNCALWDHRTCVMKPQVLQIVEANGGLMRLLFEKSKPIEVPESKLLIKLSLVHQDRQRLPESWLDLLHQELRDPHLVFKTDDMYQMSRSKRGYWFGWEWRYWRWVYVFKNVVTCGDKMRDLALTVNPKFWSDPAFRFLTKFLLYTRSGSCSTHCARGCC